jgi:hypothetical protein
VAIGKISGVMLQTNLVRQGVALTIDGNLTQFDVTNRRVGINTTTPAYSLDVSGNAQLANIVFYNDTITSTTGSIKLGSVANVKMTGGSPDSILYTDGNGNLAFSTLTVLAGLEGFTGNNILVGTTTQSNDGYGTNALTTGMDIATAISTLDNILGNITNSSGNLIHVTGTITSPTIDVINANVAAANVAIISVQANLTAYETYANTQISTTNATISAYETYANANAAVQTIAITSLATGANANIAANLASGITTNIITTGNISAGNVTSIFYGNIHTDYIFGKTGNVITFVGNGAVKVPIGTTSNRPAGVNGYIRFNTDTPALEYFDGSMWVPITNTVTDQQIIPDGASNTYTLQQSATAIGLIVSINGTLQNPNSAYTVSGTQITFIETPLVDDIIDIRFLGASVTINSTLSDDLVVQGNVTVGGILQIPQSTKANNAPGVAGQVSWDANYFYICTATNTWKRAPLTGGY